MNKLPRSARVRSETSRRCPMPMPRKTTERKVSACRGNAEIVKSGWEVSMTTRSRLFPAPAPGLDAWRSCVSSAVRLNSARTAAANASAALGRKPSADMAGTAELLNSRAFGATARLVQFQFSTGGRPRKFRWNQNYGKYFDDSSGATGRPIQNDLSDVTIRAPAPERGSGRQIAQRFAKSINL